MDSRRALVQADASLHQLAPTLGGGLRELSTTFHALRDQILGDETLFSWGYKVEYDWCTHSVS